MFASFGQILQEMDNSCFNFYLCCFCGRSLIQLSQLNSEELHLSSLNQSNYTAAALAVVTPVNKSLENAVTESLSIIQYLGIQKLIHTAFLK